MGPEFMTLMLAALGVAGEDIAAGDVWVATGADGQIAGVVALAPGDAPGALDLNKLSIEPRHIPQRRRPCAACACDRGGAAARRLTRAKRSWSTTACEPSAFRTPITRNDIGFACRRLPVWGPCKPSRAGTSTSVRTARSK